MHILNLQPFLHRNKTIIARCWPKRFRAGCLLVLLALLPLCAAAQFAVTDGLVLWLKADEGVATDINGFVTDWADASLNLNDAAQHDVSIAPLLVVNAVNSRPVVRFDGVDDYMEIANAAT